MADPHSGRVMGGGSGVGVITAITISGCSLLFLVLLRSKLAQKDEPEFPSSLSSPSSTEGIKMTMEKKKKKKKQVVRFAEDVVEPRGSGAEYRARLRLRRRSSVKPAAAAGAVGTGEGGSKGPVRAAEEGQERRRKPVTCGGGGAVPANRRALYRGLTQYRSQMATLMLYHT